MKHLALLLASSMMLATAVPAYAAGSSDTDSLSPKNTPSTASSAPDDSSSSEEAAPPDNGDNNTQAAAGNVTARDPQTVLDELKTLGYPGKLENLDSGRTRIAVQISGLKTFIEFYDCADDLTDCYTLLFNVAIDLPKGTTLEKANEWNSKKITGRVWLDDDKDPTVDFALSTFTGVSADTFDQNIKFWDQVIGNFKDFFGI
jgi:hypothetical protein